MSVNSSSVLVKMLLQLTHLGIDATVEDDRIRLKPASRLSVDYFNFIRACKPELMALLQDPRRRWRAQAEALLVNIAPEDREDLLDMFAEREAIAAVHGELDDHNAGQMAYRTLLAHINKEFKPNE